MAHRTRDELGAALAHVLAAPADAGTLTMLVRRPAVDEREVLAEGRLCFADGLEGDNWNRRASARTDDGSPHPDMQLNVISARVSDFLSTDGDHRALCGDQLHVDIDLTEANLPAGTRLAIGGAVIEVTDQPHRGCAKFAARFGAEARRWVLDGDRSGLRLRGLNARVVQEGIVRPGDTVTVVRPR